MSPFSFCMQNQLTKWERSAPKQDRTRIARPPVYKIKSRESFATCRVPIGSGSPICFLSMDRADEESVKREGRNVGVTRAIGLLKLRHKLKIFSKTLRIEFRLRNRTLVRADKKAGTQASFAGSSGLLLGTLVFVPFLSPAIAMSGLPEKCLLLAVCGERESNLRGRTHQKLRFESFGVIFF